jgi:hypothetical protein
VDTIKVPAAGATAYMAVDASVAASVGHAKVGVENEPVTVLPLVAKKMRAPDVSVPTAADTTLDAIVYKAGAEIVVTAKLSAKGLIAYKVAVERAATEAGQPTAPPRKVPVTVAAVLVSKATR